MSSISASVVSMLYNAQLLRCAGEDGVAAYGVLTYVSLVFQVSAVLIFPLIWEVDGIWLSIAAAEALAAAVTAAFLWDLRKKYQY